MARTQRSTKARTNGEGAKRATAAPSLVEARAPAVGSIQEHTRTAALHWWRLWTTPWWLAERPSTEAAAPPAAALAVSAPQPRKRAASKAATKVRRRPARVKAAARRKR